MSKSCVGCKFLYEDGCGYSNYTWMDTYIRCALNKNPNLSGKDVEAPYEFRHDGQTLNVLEDARCERFDAGSKITLDPDREGVPYDYRSAWDPYDFDDEEQYKAIAEAEGWELVLPFDEYRNGKAERKRIQPGDPS